jgi:hypothetical protein
MIRFGSPIGSTFPAGSRFGVRGSPLSLKSASSAMRVAASRRSGLPVLPRNALASERSVDSSFGIIALSPYRCIVAGHAQPLQCHQKANRSVKHDRAGQSWGFRRRLHIFLIRPRCQTPPFLLDRQTLIPFDPPDTVGPSDEYCADVALRTFRSLVEVRRAHAPCDPVHSAEPLAPPAEEQPDE